MFLFLSRPKLSFFFSKLNFDTFFRKQALISCNFVSQVNVSWFKKVEIFILENKTKKKKFGGVCSFSDYL